MIAPGIALLDGGLKVYKKAEKVRALAASIQDKRFSGYIGIGHTRWTTHGASNSSNAHPQVSASGKLAIVHNGTIENYSTLQQQLLKFLIPMKR